MLIHAFCKICEHEIVLQECKSRQKQFQVYTKHVNNQTNCRTALVQFKISSHYGFKYFLLISKKEYGV